MSPHAVEARQVNSGRESRAVGCCAVSHDVVTLGLPSGSHDATVLSEVGHA